jgi:hypothetical protein
MKKCYEEFEHGVGACLVVEAGDGNWSFPWATLGCIHWPQPDGGEISIHFGKHEIAMVGKELEPLFTSLSQGKVKVVRVGKEGDLTINSIKVREKDE